MSRDAYAWYKPYVEAKAAELAADEAEQKAANRYTFIILTNPMDERAIVRASLAVYRTQYKAWQARERLYLARRMAKARSRSKA